ncbi:MULTISPECIES: hypothetical protein [Halomonadaceae]|uniref:Erythromycin esterase family protein n=1 Tax=Modicisalibacter zincidurans TaxID=1178777 RepID=A0ABP9QZ14_9GAMM|nr:MULTISPECIES: hypothetical protein [Halomonas]MCD6009568.1 hypothetical protein [Halomonas sp. IOP_31]MEA3250686.1 hypothetical protein [Pseudomonadota bacterium]
MTPLDCVNGLASRLAGQPSDYDRLMEQVGERPFVLLGEASHGTDEFYRMRAERRTGRAALGVLPRWAAQRRP